MADILTQIQDFLDDLLLQMHSTMHVVNFQAPSNRITGQPEMSFNESGPAQQTQDPSTQPATQAQTPATGTQPTQSLQNSASTGMQGVSQDVVAAAQSTGPATQPASQAEQDFSATLRELSRDLVMKEQAIELLISRLPGIGTSEQQQLDRMKELERQLEELEGERVEAVKEKERLGVLLGERVRGFGAV